MEVAIIDRMGRESGALDGLRPRRFDLVLVGAAVLLTLVTVILAADVDMRLVIVDRTLDVAVTSFTMLAAAGLALLTFPRYQESGRLSLLLQSSAFVLSATFSGLTVVLVLSKLDSQLGMTPRDAQATAAVRHGRHPADHRRPVPGRPVSRPCARSGRGSRGPGTCCWRRCCWSWASRSSRTRCGSSWRRSSTRRASGRCSRTPRAPVVSMASRPWPSAPWSSRCW